MNTYYTCLVWICLDCDSHRTNNLK